MGGPARLFLCFFLLLFVPSLVYAAITDESSGELFGASLILACVCTAFLAWKGHRKTI